MEIGFRLSERALGEKSADGTHIDAAEQLSGSVVNPDLARIADAASRVSSNEEALAVMDGLRATKGLTESGIAPDVLSKLLPDDEVIVLPRVDCAAGSLGYRVFKRTFDIVSCGAALLALAVPMVIIGICVKVESPGPAIYAQRRLGKDGKVFSIYKFRSMYADAEARGARWAAGDDPRITPLGKKLRKTRLDEIPQFWNVVKGDMSLIGPRPERPAFSDEFEKRIIGWNQHMMVRPGITGLAQITGGYELLPKEKALYDLEYIENRSLAMDWSIIWRTLRTMVTGDGAR